MTKYIISGYIGFDNFGDEAIAKVLTDKLKTNGAEKITLISSNPQKTSQIYNVDACSMLNFFKPLANADILISGGGSLLQDVTSLKSLIYYLGVIYTALLLKKKVIIFAQGIGPINSGIGKSLTKFALKHCEKISVRDKKSQTLLCTWNINSELVKDPIFDIELPEHNHNKGKVGIQLRSFKTMSYEFLKNLAKEVAQRFYNKEIHIISLQDSLDLELCNQFANVLKNYNIEKVKVFSKLSINQAVEQIANLEYLIGMRFHANVVGIKAGIKTLAINYDPKVQKLAEEYNLPLIQLNQTDFSKEFDELINKN